MDNVNLVINKKEITKRIIALVKTSIIITLMFYFIGFSNALILKVYFIVMGVYILPSLLLLIEYLHYTLKLKEVNLTSEYINITYKNSENKQIAYSTIKVIKLYKSASKDKGSFTIFDNEDYYFAGIITDSNERIPLTSLFGPSLDNALALFKNIPLYRVKTGFAYLFKLND